MKQARTTAYLLVTGACLGGATSLPAQTAATVAIQTEERFRGRPVSAERPVLRVDVSHETRSGLYLGGAFTAVARDGVRPLAAQQYIGYAFRTRSGVTVEGGVVNRFYGRAFSGGFATAFVEAFAGMTQRRWSGRLYVSSSYYGTGRITTYLEVTRAIKLAERLTLDAQAGVLVPLTQAPNPRFVRGQYDGRVGVTRAAGRVDLHIGASWAGPRPAFFGTRARGHGAIIVGASRGF